MLTNKRILTVDDASTIRAFLHTVLGAQGAQVDEAGSGAEALALLTPAAPAAQVEDPIRAAVQLPAPLRGDRVNKREASARMMTPCKYDLILLDLMLPDMDGIQVLEHIRQISDAVTVVMLTGAGGVKSATAAVREGADGYIEKQDLSIGGDLSEFLYALQQALDHRAGIVAKAQLEQVRTDFYSMVTHDLRNPAGGLYYSIKMLLDGDLGELSSEQREFLTIMRDAAEKMLQLVNDYLDYTKIDQGYLKLNPSKVDLREVVEKSMGLARLQAQARKQSFNIILPAAPVMARVDGERLKQVFDNLLSNAVKYTPEGGGITLQLEERVGDPDSHGDLRPTGAFSLGNRRAVIRVSDTGPGIPPAQQSALFTKYHRVPGQATRGIYGTGLGLLIVKEIVEAHGGTVRAESEGVPGKGTTFTVTLPLPPTS